MLNLANRARWLMTAATSAMFLAAVACDVKEELLEPQNPGVIDPSAVTSPAAAASASARSVSSRVAPPAAKACGSTAAC